MASEDEENLTPEVTALLFKSQSQQRNDRRILRDKYLELIEEAQRQREDEFDANSIMENMNQADELFKEVCRAREAVFDAQLLNIHGEIAKKKAHSLYAGSPFNFATFLRKLTLQLSGRYEDSDDVNLEEEDWHHIGNKVFRMYNRAPKLNFIQGTEPIEIVRQQRRLKDVDLKSKRSEPKVVDASTQKKTITDKTYEEIQRIKKLFSNLYKKKGAPICYFEFTVDPNSFPRTIENMFHLAFLIKEHEVHLSLDSNELPVIEPVIAGGPTRGYETSQSVLTMSVSKWKQLIEVFEIKESAIPPAASYGHGVR